MEDLIIKLTDSQEILTKEMKFIKKEFEEYKLGIRESGIHGSKSI